MWVWVWVWVPQGACGRPRKTVGTIGLMFRGGEWRSSTADAADAAPGCRPLAGPAQLLRIPDSKGPPPARPREVTCPAWSCPSFRLSQSTPYQSFTYHHHHHDHHDHHTTTTCPSKVVAAGLPTCPVLCAAVSRSLSLVFFSFSVSFLPHLFSHSIWCLVLSLHFLLFLSPSWQPLHILYLPFPKWSLPKHNHIPVTPSCRRPDFFPLLPVFSFPRYIPVLYPGNCSQDPRAWHSPLPPNRPICPSKLQSRSIPRR